MELNKLFKYSNHEIRIIQKDNDIWFVAKDICDVLGLKNNTSLIKIPIQNKGTHNMSDTTGRRQEMTIINEPAIYQLIFKSKKQEAIQFQQWIYNEVLPQIRRTGKYSLIDKVPFKKLSFKIQNEYDLHSKIVNYIRTVHQDTLMISTLGELQDTDDKRIKAYNMGYQTGSPDLVVAEITKQYNGLAIEFKSPNRQGELSDKQRQKISQYKSRGFQILISNDYDEILITIYNYLQQKRIKCEYCNCRFKSIDTLDTHNKIIHRISP